ncbi:TRAP transporter small permease subunit [Colwellia sp. 1_MG-2023]|uniref:TRAP transporter small permease subunit n=1 Tax=Colwellia sp. 1_MG-2023 TaxID=3062649 RepID=UPI0026E3A705|nr:TRAP transporter small permease subunit [Colwellia sp. 1_MG-2023]MDO6444219.1 TRAP transporter small permease subunit [Colwellia sp. 1_MG-2023]
MSFKWLENTISSIDKFTDTTGKLIAWLTFAMVVVSFAIVVLRYVFNLGWVAMQESVLYFHGIVFMLGAAYTLKVDGHVRVDIFYQRFSKKQQAMVNLFGALFLLLPVCITIFIISFDYVAVSWEIMEKSSEAGGLPLVFINKSLILLFVISLLLQGVAEIGRNLLIITSYNFAKTDLEGGI